MCNNKHFMTAISTINDTQAVGSEMRPCRVRSGLLILCQPSWSVCTLNLVLCPLVIICSSLRRRRSCSGLREGLPAVRLQAKSFVTQSPVAVTSSISLSLFFPFSSPLLLLLSLSSSPPLLSAVGIKAPQTVLVWHIKKINMKFMLLFSCFHTSCTHRML